MKVVAVSYLSRAGLDCYPFEAVHRSVAPVVDEYWGLVRVGGLIFFDDISLGVEMERLWASLPEPKRRLDALHYTGFGALEVQRG